MKPKCILLALRLFAILLLITVFSACNKEVIETAVNGTEADSSGISASGRAQSSHAVLLVIDEESIDNGNKPNYFSEREVNDHIARLNQRQPLSYFKNNVGKSIVLYTGEVGDEGWHAIKSIPNSWINAGPTRNGASNYLAAGPGLGGGNDDREVLLDKIPNVTPLRARGLKMLTGQTILAVVYDGDVSINYGPLNGSLKGETLGLVALQVQKVERRTDGSSGSLPKVTVKIVNVDTIKKLPLKLFSNAPVPRSSSEPFDVNPPASVSAISLTNAR